MERQALISDDRVYRYTLFRRWGSGDPVLFVMLNPSTADAYKEDPTLKRCISFAKREGFGALTVGNLFAYRTAFPAELVDSFDHGERPEGPLNDDCISGLKANASAVIVAWGNAPKLLRWRIAKVLKLLEPRALYCLGTTKSGDPRHPVRLAANTPLELYRPASSTIALPPFYRLRDIPF